MLSSYSFQGQDLFVIHVCGGQRGGFFIDSGASDGVLGSNSLLLETEYGWNGICIEPNESLFARLAAHRSCICLNACLYDREGEVDFLEAADVYGGIVDEYDPGHLQFVQAFIRSKGMSSCGSQAITVSKRSLTIRSILRSCSAPDVIDYWSLDTEGSELAILRSFPFDEYRVRVLTVEHNNTPAREEIAAFLATHGLRRVKCLGIDDCYVWGHDVERPAWRSAVWAGRVGSATSGSIV
ncbi:FkbM family methyltransferase [Paraburkholderia sp. MM5477-R1]|uniref:FkbM family methyltransferase n=1 Tax=Paraburkholderia sp. MM5477-R1 TaxID=2991062 RepID=UPI003D1C3233